MASSSSNTSSSSSATTSTPSAARVLPTTAAAPAASAALGIAPSGIASVAAPAVAHAAVAAFELNVATALGVSRSIVPPHTNFAPAHWMGGGGRVVNSAGVFPPGYVLPLSAASWWESAPGPRSTFAPVMWSQPFASSTTVASTPTYTRHASAASSSTAPPAPDIAHAQEQGACTSPAPDVTNIADAAQEPGASSSSAPKIVRTSLNPDAPAFTPTVQMCQECRDRPALIGSRNCGHLALCDLCYRRRCVCPCCGVPVVNWVDYRRVDSCW